jgi:putative transposase
MPWKETCPMEQRLRFIVECRDGDESFAAICRAFGVSRKTGYKWLERYEALGAAGLCDEGRGAHAHPGWLPDAAVDAIVEARKEHPHWGPKKLQVWLLDRRPSLPKVGVSTIAGVLSRLGLIRPRRRRPRTPRYAGPLDPCVAPNDVWCADFKGHFALGDGSRCYPLTITDAASRYLLKCEALHETGEIRVRKHFERAFVEFGLPTKLRTDNGPPFASKSLGGLSRLAIWWIKLGILPERIEPGHPEQNGRHERMHRTLKQEATVPAKYRLVGQQRVFDAFRHEYNDVRPHEALEQRPPAKVYSASLRPMPSSLSSPEYGNDMEVRLVDRDGRIRWNMSRLPITPLLSGEHVAARRLSDSQWEWFYGPIKLGILDERREKLRIVTKS